MATAPTTSDPATTLSREDQGWLSLQHEEHRQLVRAAIWNRLGRTSDRATIDELAAETWARATRQLAAGNFDRERRFAPWISSIATNVCREWLRREQRDGDLADPESIVGQDDRTARRLLELHQALADCLAALPATQQRLYQLMFIEKRSGRAAAECLGVAEATVRTRYLPRLFRAVAICLKHKGYDELDEDLQ